MTRRTYSWKETSELDNISIYSEFCINLSMRRVQIDLKNAYGYLNNFGLIILKIFYHRSGNLYNNI